MKRPSVEVNQSVRIDQVIECRGLMETVLNKLRQERDERQGLNLIGLRELSEAITCFETGCMWMNRSNFADRPYTPVINDQPRKL